MILKYKLQNIAFSNIHKFRRTPKLGLFFSSYIKDVTKSIFTCITFVVLSIDMMQISHLCINMQLVIRVFCKTFCMAESHKKYPPHLLHHH